MQQILEAWVGAKRVHLGFNVEITEPKRPFFQGFPQPRESFILIRASPRDLPRNFALQ